MSEAIRGIFDGRQFERRFTVYYFYAKYVAREKRWVEFYKKLGIVMTAVCIIETFNRLDKHQQQLFIDEAYGFHCKQRYYTKSTGGEPDLLAPKLRHFPEEPRPPPRRASALYLREVKKKMLEGISSDSNSSVTAWSELDDQTQMMYLKKLQNLTREYIGKYENFVRNMTPNDLVEYVVRRAADWECLDATDKSKEFDQAVYSIAESARSRPSDKTFSLRITQDGQDPEPEVYPMISEEGSEFYGNMVKHSFCYKNNPFSVQKRGPPKVQKNCLVQRLCNLTEDGIRTRRKGNRKKKKGDESDVPSSTSDEDEAEYSHLPRSCLEIKKDKRFRQKLRAIERHAYQPLESFDQVEQDPRWNYSEGREKTLAELVKAKKWEQIRSAIGSKRPKTVKPRSIKQSRKIAILNAAKNLISKNMAQLGVNNNEVEKEIQKTPKTPSRVGPLRSRRSVRAKAIVPQASCQESESEDDNDADESTTRFINAASNVKQKKNEEVPEFIAEGRSSPPPALASTSTFTPRNPGLALVRASPARSLRSTASPFKIPATKNSSTPSKSVSTVKIGKPDAVSAPTVNFSTTSSTQEQTIDEYEILDTLDNDMAGVAVLSESELQQFPELWN